MKEDENLKSKRSWTIYPVVIWVMAACFAVSRPLLTKQHPVTESILPSQLGLLFIGIFILIMAEAFFLVRLQKIALYLACVICATWALFILFRIVLAVQYSPAIFAGPVSGELVYLPAVTAMGLNTLVVWYLVKQLKEA